MFMIPLGIQEATCALVGAAIGAMNVKAAKKIWKVISGITFVVIFIVGFAMYFARK